MHQLLGSRRHYCNWIKQRIERYNFTEGEDYVCFSRPAEGYIGGRPATDYQITLDMAKALCWIENNDKGIKAYRLLTNLKHQSLLSVMPSSNQTLEQAIVTLTHTLQALSQPLQQHLALHACADMCDVKLPDDLPKRLASWLEGRQYCTLAEVCEALFGLPLNELSRHGHTHMRLLLEEQGWQLQSGHVYRPG